MTPVFIAALVAWFLTVFCLFRILSLKTKLDSYKKRENILENNRNHLTKKIKRINGTNNRLLESLKEVSELSNKLFAMYQSETRARVEVEMKALEERKQFMGLSGFDYRTEEEEGIL